MRVLATGFGFSLGLVALVAQAAGPPAQRDLSSSELLNKGLLDPNVAHMERAAIAFQLESQAAARNDPWLLYVVGSLYRLGNDHNKWSPYPRNLDKAREYLSRAALKGRVGAMGKLAFLELEAGNRFEANVWGQLYAHYQLELSRDGREETAETLGARGIASILALVQDGFPKAEVTKLEERVGSIISAYDRDIRGGAARQSQLFASNPLRNARMDRCTVPRDDLKGSRARDQRYSAGGAEYFLAFADDGSVREIWLLDVWPDARTERVLRTCAGRYRVKPVDALAGKEEVALLPIAIVDERLRLKDQRSK